VVIAMNVENYAADQLDVVMITGRYSTLLASELDSRIRNRSLHSHLITDEIAASEGRPRRSQTKPAEQFRRRWLKGLWHKHFFQPGYMLKNLELQWTEARLRNAFGEQMSIGKAVHHYVIGGHTARAGAAKLTGEWIVFAKQDGISYYLTLAHHEEDDEVIWRRCKTCAPEFSQLRILQEDRSG
jgi:hypothetical protein